MKTLPNNVQRNVVDMCCFFEKKMFLTFWVFFLRALLRAFVRAVAHGSFHVPCAEIKKKSNNIKPNFENKNNL